MGGGWGEGEVKLGWGMMEWRLGGGDVCTPTAWGNVLAVRGLMAGCWALASDVSVSSSSVTLLAFRTQVPLLCR